MEVSFDYILKVVKPLYSTREVGNHWFVTCYNFYINDFTITNSTYNSCLLYSCELFRFVDLQINNILMLANNTFAIVKKEAIKIIKFIT